METVCHRVAFKWCVNGLNGHLGEQCLLEGVSCEDSKVDCEFSDGNVEEQTPWEGDMRHL